MQLGQQIIQGREGNYEYIGETKAAAAIPSSTKMDQLIYVAKAITHTYKCTYTTTHIYVRVVIAAARRGVGGRSAAAADRSDFLLQSYLRCTIKTYKECCSI